MQKYEIAKFLMQGKRKFSNEFIFVSNNLVSTIFSQFSRSNTYLYPNYEFLNDYIQHLKLNPLDYSLENIKELENIISDTENHNNFIDNAFSDGDEGSDLKLKLFFVSSQNDQDLKKNINLTNFLLFLFINSGITFNPLNGTSNLHYEILKMNNISLSRSSTQADPLYSLKDSNLKDYIRQKNGGYIDEFIDKIKEIAFIEGVDFQEALDNQISILYHETRKMKMKHLDTIKQILSINDVQTILASKTPSKHKEVYSLVTLNLFNSFQIAFKPEYSFLLSKHDSYDLIPFNIFHFEGKVFNLDAPTSIAKIYEKVLDQIGRENYTDEEMLKVNELLSIYRENELKEKFSQQNIEKNSVRKAKI